MQFYLKAVLLSVALSGALAKPQYYSPPAPHAHEQYVTPIPILSYTQEVNPDGSYYFNYQTGNGIAAEEKGYIEKQGDQEINKVVGFFVYPNKEDGKQISLRYTADENGFLAYGDHLPTPPPLPVELVKAYQNAPQDEAQYDEQGFPIGGPGSSKPSFGIPPRKY